MACRLHCLALHPVRALFSVPFLPIGRPNKATVETDDGAAETIVRRKVDGRRRKT